MTLLRKIEGAGQFEARNNREKEPTMTRFTKLAFLLCLPWAASAVSHSAFAATIEENISARLDALEKENAPLKQRLKRIETSRVTSRHALPPPGEPAGLATFGGATTALDARAQDNRTPQFYKSPVDIR